MKTCIFGGTFDPPHIGHLLIAQTIIESENFDRLIFLPAHLSPVKRGREMSPPEKRLKMLTMALLNNDNFEISDFEIKIRYFPETSIFWSTSICAPNFDVLQCQ